MPLWEVDVAEVSHRYVEAESKEAAVTQVQEAIIASLDLRASRADTALSQFYEEAGPLRRKKILAAMDGLSSPRRVSDERRKLRRLTKSLEAQDAWVKKRVAEAPPIDPEVVKRLLALREVDHIDENLRRFKDDDSTRLYRR